MDRKLARLSKDEITIPNWEIYCDDLGILTHLKWWTGKQICNNVKYQDNRESQKLDK